MESVLAAKTNGWFQKGAYRAKDEVGFNGMKIIGAMQVEYSSAMYISIVSIKMGVRVCHVGSQT